MAKNRITSERLRELVTYEPTTGLFTRLRGSGGVLPGQTPEYVNRCGHVEFRLDNELYKAHMLAWFWVYGTWPDARLIHKNGVKHDNRVENLRYSRRYNKEPLTVERVKCLFIYDPDSGVFTRRVQVSNQHVGDTVGCLGKRGYLVANIDGKIQYLHRVAWLYMTGSWPVKKLGHKNRIKTDNRWDNLRIASDYQNASNTSRKNKSNTDVRGVYFCTRTSMYVAEVRHRGKRVLYKRYKTLEEAKCVVEQIRSKYHGEFAVHTYED